MSFSALPCRTGFRAVLLSVLLILPLAACQDRTGGEQAPVATAPKPIEKAAPAPQPISPPPQETPPPPPVATAPPPPPAPDLQAPVLNAPSAEETGPEPIRIGLLLPLSGPARPVGNALLNAAEMALFDIGDKRLMLLPADTKGTAQGAREAASRLLAEGAEILLGPLFSRAVMAVKPLAAERRIAVIAFSNDSDAAGGGAYLLGIRPEEEIDRISGFAASQKLRRIGAFLPDNAYGRKIATALAAASRRYFLDPARTAFYPPDAPAGSETLTSVARDFADFSRRAAALRQERARLKASSDAAAKAALARLKNRDSLGPPPFDAVLLAEGGSRLQAVAPLLSYFDIDPAEIRYLGTSQWYRPQTLKEPSVQGGWFPAPPPVMTEAFRNKYRATFKTIPPAIATLGYDAIALAATLAADAPDPVSRFSPQAITAEEGFSGYTGVFRLHPDGTSEHGLAVLQVTREGFRVLDPAPQDFTPLTN